MERVDDTAANATGGCAGVSEGVLQMGICMDEYVDAISLIKECEKYISKLKTQCVDSMFSREYSWRAKHPFKVMSFVNAMTWRMYDMSHAALILMKEEAVIPSLCLVRACWENMVATFELTELVQSCCEQKALPRDVDETLMRILYSNRYDKDNRYMDGEHYEHFKEYKAKNILTLVQKLEKRYPETKDFYSTICEFVHPNGDGVGGSYSHLDESTQSVSFGPQFSRESQLFPAFITTLSCFVDLYLKFVELIEEDIMDFSRLCEKSLSI